MRTRRPVEEQQQREDDADEEPGQRVEDQHTAERRDGAMKSARAATP